VQCNASQTVVVVIINMLELVLVYSFIIYPSPPPSSSSVSHHNSPLESRSRQSRRGILRINAVVVFFPSLDAPGFTRRALPVQTSLLLILLILLRQRRGNSPTDAPVEPIARAARDTGPGIALGALGGGERGAAGGGVSLTPQTRQTTAAIDGADVRAHRLEGGEGAALRLDFADDVFADGLAHIGGGAVEPLALLLEEVGGDALGFRGQVLLVAAGLVELGDGFVDLVALDAGAGLEAVGGRELGLGDCLRLEQFAEEDVAVGEGFLGDEGVAAVVLEGVAEGGCFGCALGGVEVASGLDNLSDLLVCMGQTDVCLLRLHCCEFGAQVGLGNTEICTC
jgi:hypothetical protein